ncbi:unnamed protein product [Polarella glacialis]|uniref:Palmitoyltransferase n=1 Tax=Polarella glacialis TaxID=89957 RepID=A0A813H4Y6_POLGL|nr:unnamed protein product [Polarella glacialis]
MDENFKAKQRKAAAAVPSALDESLESGNCSSGVCREADAETLGKGHGTAALRPRVLWAGRFLLRRGPDIIAVGWYWSAVVVGHWYTIAELLQPPDCLLSQVVWPCYLVVHALLNVAWIGMVYHGPGRTPPASDGPSELPEDLVSALATGRLCKEKPFGAKDDWCSPCNMWKPALAHHCSVCGRCSLWMDHHCNFAGTCVGFRNLRLYLVWLLYGHALMGLWILLSFRRMWWTPPSGFWGWGGWAQWVMWGIYIYKNLGTLFFYCTVTVGKLAAGWPSWVLLTKFYGLCEVAIQLEKDAAASASALEQPTFAPTGGSFTCFGVTSAPKGGIAGELAALRGAMKEVSRAGQVTLRGLFSRPSLIQNVGLAFGEEPSWRWLLPLATGGTGNPLQPEFYNADVCKSWASLATSMSRCEAELEALVRPRFNLEDLEAEQQRAESFRPSEGTAGSGEPRCLVATDALLTYRQDPHKQLGPHSLGSLSL